MESGNKGDAAKPQKGEQQPLFFGYQDELLSEITILQHYLDKSFYLVELPKEGIALKAIQQKFLEKGVRGDSGFG